MVRIISESSIAAGVRRIEAITGKAVEDFLDKTEDFVRDLRQLFNNAPDLMATVRKCIEDNADLKRQVDDFKAQQAANFKNDMIQSVREVNGVKVFAGVFPLDAQSAKDIAFQLRAQFPENIVVAIGGVADGKPNLTVALSDDLVKDGRNAGQIVRESAKLIQGGGGGQPHFATAGGKNPDGLKSAIDKIIELAC